MAQADIWDPVQVHNAAQAAYNGATTPPQRMPTPAAAPPQAPAAGYLAAGLQPSAAAPVPGTLTPPQAPAYPAAAGLDYKPPWAAANPVLGHKEPEKVIGAITRRDDTLTEVRLTKTAPGQMFGFQIDPAMDNRAAVIAYIDPAGLLERWNWNNPGQSIREGDVIVCVNGLANNLEAMKTEMNTSGIAMLVQRR